MTSNCSCIIIGWLWVHLEITSNCSCIFIG